MRHSQVKPLKGAVRHLINAIVLYETKKYPGIEL